MRTEQEQRMELARQLYRKHNYNLALEIVVALASEGYEPAQAVLCSENGRVGLKELKQIVEGWQKSGDARAYFKLGQFYQNGCWFQQDRIRAIQHYQWAANLKHELALFEMGLCYFEGPGDPIELKKGFECWEQAANKGTVQAQVALGFYYQHGLQGVPRDPKKAVEWYAEALKAKSSPPNYKAMAQYSLGLCYQLGQGVKRDDKRAVTLYISALTHGGAFAKVCLGLCYEFGIGGVNKDEKRAAGLYQQATEQQGAICPIAYSHLGRCCDYGKGVDQDKKRAIELYHLAIQKWHQMIKENSINVGFCAELYQLAAHQGCPDALFHLGLCFEFGQGFARDTTEASNLYQAAIQKGYSMAEEHLKRLLESEKEPLIPIRKQGQLILMQMPPQNVQPAALIPASSAPSIPPEIKEKKDDVPDQKQAPKKGPPPL